MAEKRDVSEVCFVPPPIKRRRRSSADGDSRQESAERLEASRSGEVCLKGPRRGRELSDFSQTINQAYVLAQCALGELHAGEELGVWELVPPGGAAVPEGGAAQSLDHKDKADRADRRNATDGIDSLTPCSHSTCAGLLGLFIPGREEELRRRLQKTLAVCGQCTLLYGVDGSDITPLLFPTKKGSSNIWTKCSINHLYTNVTMFCFNSADLCERNTVSQLLIKSAFTCHLCHDCRSMRENCKDVELDFDTTMYCISNKTHPLLKDSEGDVFERGLHQKAHCKSSCWTEARDNRSALVMDVCDVVTHHDVEISAEVEDQLFMDAGVNTAPCSHDTPVQLAAKLGDFRLLQEVLWRGVSADSVTEANKQTALMEAARSGRLDMVEQLVRHQANVNLRLDDENDDLNGYTALDVAIAYGSNECAEYLLSCDASIELDTAVILSVLHQNIKSLTWLCRHFPWKEVEAKIVSLGLLHAAARGGHEDLLSMLMEFGVDVNSVHRHQTPLMVAVTCDTVDCLIQQGADVNAVIKTSDGQMTALLNAISPQYFSALESKHRNVNVFGELELIVRKLVQQGASLTAVDAAGNTPLMVACGIHGAESIVQFLSSVSTVSNIQINSGGESMLHIAVRSNALENVKAIAKTSLGQVNLQNHLGTTPLMIAAVNGNTDIMEHLIKRGALVNIRDHGGNSSLIHAVKSYRCNAEHIKMLLEAGADPNVENEMGYCAVTTAVANLNKEALCILLEPQFKLAEDKKQKALGLLLAGNVFTHKAVECATLLLDQGTCSSKINPGIIHRFITDGHTDIVLKLIHNGTPPADVKQDDHIISGHCWPVATVSPVCAALLTNQCGLAHHLAELWFYTKLDYRMMNNVRLKEHLLRNKYTECEHLIREISGHTMSLKVLTFTTVSDAIGKRCDRANKIASLSVPEIVKSMLMFKAH